MDDIEETVRLLVMEHANKPGWSAKRFGFLLAAEGIQLDAVHKIRLWGQYGAANATHDPETGRPWTTEQRWARAVGA